MPTLVECHLTSTKIVHNVRQRIPFEESNPLKDDLLTSGMIIENYIFGGRQPKKGSLRLSFEDLDREQNLKDIRRSQQREIELHIILMKELKMEREKHQLRLFIRSISCSFEESNPLKDDLLTSGMIIENYIFGGRQPKKGSVRLSEVYDCCYIKIIVHISGHSLHLENTNKQSELELHRTLKTDRQIYCLGGAVHRFEGRLFDDSPSILLPVWHMLFPAKMTNFFGITSDQFDKFQDRSKIDKLLQQQQNKRGTSKAENRVRSENDRLMCKICYIYQLNVLFLPCSHVVACNRCAAKLKTCAVCRADIKEALPAYFN